MTCCGTPKPIRYRIEEVHGVFAGWYVMSECETCGVTRRESLAHITEQGAKDHMAALSRTPTPKEMKK